MSRALKTITVLSLLLNLLLAGFIIGHMCRSAMAQRMHDQIEQVAKTLPDDKRAHFEKVMGRAEKDADDFHKQFDRSRDKAAQILKADKFDRNAFIAQMHDIEQLHAQLRQRMAEALAEAASDLTPAQRATMVDMLRPPAPPASPRDNK